MYIVGYILANINYTISVMVVTVVAVGIIKVIVSYFKALFNISGLCLVCWGFV